jgi:hypothetical protein
LFDKWVGENINRAISDQDPVRDDVIAYLMVLDEIKLFMESKNTVEPTVSSS